MLNLLPKEQKDKITREYRVRFWIAAFALALAGEVISLILLIPPFITAKTRLSILDSQSASLKVQNITAEASSLGNIVKEANKNLQAFVSSSTPTGVISAIQNVVGARDRSARITNLSYRADNGQQRFVVIGNADSRQSLLDFTKKLKGQPGVVSVELPVSGFAKSQDIDFSINVLMNPANNL
jgi:hypothetical protein